MNANTSNGPALTVFVGVFLLVTLLGLAASRWRRPAGPATLNEWGLGGRRFGAWVSWFLLGGDFYTAYTMIALPALVYKVGAFGFFALPYTIVVYPFMFAVMPRLWRYARERGHITAGDIVRGRYGNRGLELAVSLTGLVATMPNIALQLVGLEVVLKAIGLTGHIPILVAFAVLSLYTYTSGLRAPALIAFVKDTMIYIVVIAAIVLISAKLGGYGQIFAAAGTHFASHKTGGGLILNESQSLPYATLALGSALASLFYSHTLTGILAANSGQTIRRNSMMLPAYTLLLGLIALFGFAAIAMGINVRDANDIVPTLLRQLFPSWLTGFALAAIAIGAFVPAAVMSIGAANLFTRNVWKVWVKPDIDEQSEASVAKVVSLLVKVGALLAVLFLPIEYALNFQLLAGLITLQILPSVIFGLYGSFFTGRGLLAGWLVGIGFGVGMSISDGLKPLHTIAIGSGHYTVYIGLLALVCNVAVAFLLSLANQRSTGHEDAPVTQSP